MSLNFLLEKEHTVNDFITLWGEKFPLLMELKNTQQDDEWHSEGDVHIHTDMVLSEVYKINKSENLTDKEKTTLILSALFHDICKPFTTKEKELRGRIRVVAPKHEEHGKNYLFYTMNEIVKDYEMFNNILNIVGFHQVPKLLVVRNEPNLSRKMFKLARKVPLKLIYLLEVADMKGRTCPDKDGQLEYLEFFKMYAEEENLWDIAEMYKSQKEFIYSELKDYPERTKEYVFAEFCRQYESGNITCPEEEISRSFQYRDSYPHLVLTCGISGIGKSTYLENNYSGYKTISLDNIREEVLGSRNNHSQERKVLDEAKKRLKVYLAKKENIVWDSTNYRFDFRKVPLGLGFNYRAFNEILLFNDAKSNILKQNKDRKHNVPENVIDNQIKKFEVPNIEESHNIKEVYRF